jgi:ubiquinone biosynthesis protein UbiJ
VLSQPAIATLNHLLAQSGWALQRLALFNGRTAQFNCAPFSLICTIQQDGSLREAGAEAAADAIIDIPPTAIPRLAMNDDAVLGQIESSGDADFLKEIFFLARSIRWDAAEDLSRITGDIAAERITQFAKVKKQQVQQGILNLAQALTEYWTEEKPLLASAQRLVQFNQEVNQLRDEVAQLESRLNLFVDSKQ